MKEKRMLTIVRNEGVPLRAAKPRPNAYCHCVSGKKLKHCCKSDTKYFFSKKPGINKDEKINLSRELENA